MPRLNKGDTLSASTNVRATAEQVYGMVSDITRVPQWSPETVRAEWLTANRFQAWNRRRLGRWRTAARVVEAHPNRRFSFIVEAMGGDWTQWTYDIETVAPGLVRLTETCRMAVSLPFGVVIFERLFLFVWDRRSDLQANLETSLAQIREIIEGQDRQ